MVSLLRWLTASWRAAQPSPSAVTAAATSSNPFRNALHKFQQKKKDKAGLSSAATSGFFSRGGKGTHSKSQPLPGSVKQVCGGQLPPVWATPPPPPRCDRPALVSPLQWTRCSRC